MNRPIVIAGGGTGGHVYVADALAKALRDQGLADQELCFLGSRRGMERTMLADDASRLILLGGRGIKRSLRPKACVDNLLALLGLVSAVAKAGWFFATHRPRAMVSVGGYAALPAGIAAWLWRCPIVVVNIDAVAGRTNQLLGSRAVASCVAFVGSGLEREVLTGAPVRPEFFGRDRSPAGRRLAKEALGVSPEKALVAVVTGSLGAASVNRAIAGLKDVWQDRHVTIYHVTGSRDFETFHALGGHYGGIDYVVTAFEDRIATLYQAADVAVTRAGALTIAELCAAGVPAVLVPLPHAPSDHQTLNARALFALGAGVMLADEHVSPMRLREELADLLDSEPRRRAMEQALSSLAHPAAASDAAKVVRDHVR